MKKNQKSPVPVNKNQKPPVPVKKNQKSPVPVKKNQKSPVPVKKNQKSPVSREEEPRIAGSSGSEPRATARRASRPALPGPRDNAPPPWRTTEKPAGSALLDLGPRPAGSAQLDLGPLPPLLFPAINTQEREWLSRLKKARRIRRVGPRLYASLPEAKVAGAARGSWATIVARLYPETLVSHRTAFEFTPTADGEIWLTSSTNRVVSYPGLELRFVRGPGPLADDPRFLTIRSSSRSRAFLENLATTRPSSRTRAVPIGDLEQRLVQILDLEGEQALNELRDRAREIAGELDWRREYRRLDGLIGALLGTRTGHLTSEIGLARAAGEPFDPACLERLQILFGELRSRPLPVLTDASNTPDHVRNKAFFESYFSN
ncbi:MAG: hypothetical protein E6J90_36145, partial [Deltaproteobacteria bacterium]